MRAHRPPRTTTLAAVVALAFLALLSTGTYTVRAGDTLGSIAAAHGTSVQALAAANGLGDADLIFVGQELELAEGEAAGDGTYRVRAGDTLGIVAARHGTSVRALVDANDLSNPNLILIGQRLVLPDGSATAPVASRTPAGGATTHVVSAGDTIAGVAARYGISAEQLVAANGLSDGRIYVGQQLRLAGGARGGPSGGGTYEVTSGDTLAQIALDNGTSVSALLSANDLDDADLVVEGQRLVLPSGGSSDLPCPISGGASFVNDWGFPRSGGRFHEGNDLFAPRGTPAVAVVAGTVVQRTGKLGGNQVRLVGDDGTSYSYTHLDAFGERGWVPAGTIIGYVGNTGNAAGGPTHVHFEVHPGSGSAVNPFPSISGAC